MAQSNGTLYPKKIGVIADDLTGAGDSGIQFSEHGLNSTVIFDLRRLNQYCLADDVVIINTESRSIPREQAYQKAFEAATLLKKSGINDVYKKIDSTLRGNWGIETKAVSDAFRHDFIVVAPSFPQMGRTTVNGNLLLNNQPLHQTEIRNDPKTPVLESYIPNMIKSQVNDAKIAVIKPKNLGDNPDHWKHNLDKLKRDGIYWLVFDAETDADLKQIVHQLSKWEEHILWAGSAGLAKFLPEALGMVKDRSPISFHHRQSPVLVVAGSISSVTTNQIQRLMAEPEILGMEIDPSGIFDRHPHYLKLIGEVCAHLNNGKDVVMYSGASAFQQKQVYELGRQRGYTKAEVSNKISARLGKITKLIMDNVPVKNLVLTGGDTAKDVYRCLGYSGMKLIMEIEPGIPLGQLIGKDPVNVITKAGAFGSESSLLNAVTILKRGFSSNDKSSDYRNYHG